MKDVYKIAIVEDEKTHADLLTEMINRYSVEKEILFSVFTFNSIEKFLTGYKKTFDLVFMDIELPGMNGLDGARRLREIDTVVTLIFVTNMAQFAVHGYEVSALDYIVKPLIYKSFAVKLDRAVSVIRSRPDRQVVVCNKDEMHRMSVNNILYVEVRGHHLIFHKTDGETVDVCGSLTGLTEELKSSGFVRCSSCYLINMRFILKINGLTVTLTDETQLQISRRKRKEFLDLFTDYIGSSYMGLSEGDK